MNSQNPSPEHQKLVAAMIVYFRDVLQYSILSAAYEGYVAPIKHGRHEPDIVAKDKGGILQLAEAKLGQDLITQTTREQFLDFANRVVTGTNVPVPFHIIVYKIDHPRLITTLNNLGLYSQIGNRIKIWTL